MPKVTRPWLINRRPFKDIDPLPAMIEKKVRLHTSKLEAKVIRRLRM